MRWAPPTRTDGVVIRGVDLRDQVRDVVTVAFYPVVLGRPQRHVYVMSVWMWNATRGRYLVRHAFLYGERYNEDADEDPNQLSPVDNIW